jgi:hypothetical protein
MVMERAVVVERKVLKQNHLSISVQALLRTARFLPPPERELLRAYYLHRRKLAQLAAELGEPRLVVHRRIVMLRRRVADPCFLLSIQFARKLPFPLAQIAREHFQRGVPLMCLAHVRGESFHTVRKQAHLARALLIAAASRRYGNGDERARRFVSALLKARPLPPRRHGRATEKVRQPPACVGG